MDIDTIKNLTEEELRSNLLTCDYRGSEIKKLLLDELLKREFERGLNACHIAVTPTPKPQLPTSGSFFTNPEDFKDFKAGYDSKFEPEQK